MPVSLSEIMQNRYGDGVGNGWNSLGAALMGNDAHRDQVGVQAAYQGSKMRDALAQERLRVAEAAKQESINSARSTFGPDFSDAVSKGDVARAVALANGAGYQPNETLLGYGAGYRGLADQRAYNAMLGGDVDAGNRMIAVAGNKPLEVSRVEGNTIVNPHAPIGQQSFAPTSIGQALMQKDNAQGAANLALAAKRGASISGTMMGGTTPDTGTHFTTQTPSGPIKFDLTNEIPPEQRNALVKAMQQGKDDTAAMADFHAAAPTSIQPGQWTATINPSPDVPQSNQIGEALASTVHGNDYLKSLDPAEAAQVQALAEGRMAFPTASALRAPKWQQMIAEVAQYDPSFEAANYGARAATRKDFTSGKSAQTINSLNTVSGHLGDLSDAAQALNNYGGVLSSLNAPKNWIANAMGDPRITRFEATKKALVDELTRVYRGTGGSESDIKAWSATLNGANSPEQLQAAAGQINALLHSKIAALGDQYRQGMGTIAAQKDFISPHAHEAFDRVSKRSGIAVGSSDITPTNSIHDAMSATPSIPPAAAEYLRQNPHLRDQFDAKFGEGAAASVLGG